MVRSHPRLLPSTDQWAEGVTGEGAEANSTLLFFFFKIYFFSEFFFARRLDPLDGVGRDGTNTDGTELTVRSS